MAEADSITKTWRTVSSKGFTLYGLKWGVLNGVVHEEWTRTRTETDTEAKSDLKWGETYTKTWGAQNGGIKLVGLEWDYLNSIVKETWAPVGQHREHKKEYGIYGTQPMNIA